MKRMLRVGCLGVCLFTLIGFKMQAQPALLNPKTQPQFMNQLPIPAVIDARNGGTFNMSITQFDQWLGLLDPITQAPLLTPVWGYNQSYPGPTILAKKDVGVNVFWWNNLLDDNQQPLPHLLPVDYTIHDAYDHTPNGTLYGVPIVTHLHGGHTESASDGLPEAWYTPGFTLKGSHFVKGDVQPYHYANSQEAATLWYHDHALGMTRLNVYAGLAGYYLLTDDHEIQLQQDHQLPATPYDLGVVIQDRMFTTDGRLFYPSAREEDEDGQEGQPNPSVLPEFFGDFILVNGKTWPVLDVEPRQYRFRVLNGSDSRFYNLFLTNNLAIQQIGSDNGLLPAPVPLAQMLIAPGERKDIILDFSHPSLWGQTIIVRNNAKTPFPKGGGVDPQTTGRIMAFRVSKPLDPNYPLTSLPATLREPILPLQTNLPPRKLILFEAEDEFDRLKPMLGTVDHGVMEWHDPISENPMLNSTEIWEIYNETMDAHPVHLHLVHMQLINRQKFNASVDEHTGKPVNIKLLGKPQAPGLDESGWKDTWVMYPGEVTRVIAKFDIEGLYVWHCHILSHEDHEMMRPMYVGNMPQPPLLSARKEAARLVSDVQDLRIHPNPFYQNFVVRFTLKEPAVVSINLYDAKGSIVKKVPAGTLSKGPCQINVNGSGPADGLYLCEIWINNERLTRKVVMQSPR